MVGSNITRSICIIGSRDRDGLDGLRVSEVVAGHVLQNCNVEFDRNRSI